MSEPIKIVEVKHSDVSEGRSAVKGILAYEIVVPRTTAEIINGRWRAIFKGNRVLSGDSEKMVRASLEGILQSSNITTQRNIYYTIRGAHPDWKYNGLELKDEKVYSAFVGGIMDNVQLSTDRTMQSFGVRAAPRGYVMGDGNIYTPGKGKVPLTAMPALSFDLVDEGVRVDSQARKVIHFEKDAGFEGLAGRDNAMMIEAMYSTCFVGETLVLGKNRYLPIKEIDEGDTLLTYDIDKKSLEETVVKKKFEHWVNIEELIRLDFGGASKFICTKTHPFYRSDEKWVKAEDLEVGEKVIDLHSEVVRLRLHNNGKKLGGIIKALIFEGKHWMQQSENKERIKEFSAVGREISHKKYGKHLLDKALEKRRLLILEGKSYQQSKEWKDIMQKRFLENPPTSNEEFKRKAIELSGLPSKLEMKIMEASKNLPITYVGNGKMFISGINPDFKVKGKRKVIEISDSGFLKFIKKDYDLYKKEREEIYNKYGFEVLFVDAKVMNLTQTVDAIKKFSVNGRVLLDKKEVSPRTLSPKWRFGDIKRVDGKIFVKVYNIHCEPYPWFIIEGSILVHNSQGYLVESANKFLADNQKRGLNIYVVHDADPHGCFTASVNVVPKDGNLTSIKNITKGQELYTLNDKKELVVTKVVEKSERWVNFNEILSLTFLRPRINRNGFKTIKILGTKNHPFNVLNKGWIKAEDLEEGDIIADAGRLVLKDKMNGQTINMQGVEHFRDMNVGWMKSISRKGVEKLYPSKVELLLIGLFSYEKIPIKFVGNSLKISDLCYPDFIIENTNKLIEIGSRIFAEKVAKIDYDEKVKKRTEIYRKAGYEVLFIDMDEEKTLSNILSKIKTYMVNGAKLISKTKINGRQLARLLQKGEAKRDEEGLWVKVYNFQCEPYNSYLVDHIHVHNCQMQLMYGMASKASNYMPSSFYPLPRSAILLGLFPRVGQGLKLPPEEVGEESRKIIPNLYKLAEEHPEMLPELEIIDKRNEQWEFQALNGLGSDAPGIYLIEALRIKGDEIKYVPEAEEVKKAINDTIIDDLKDYIDRKIDSYVDNWFQNGGLKAQLVEKITEQLEGEIDSWTDLAQKEIENMVEIDPEKYREAIKKELVDDPKRYWNQAASSVVYDMVTKKFEITADPKVELTLENTKVESRIEISPPVTRDETLTKDDIIDSIERKMVTNTQKRTPLVNKIRKVMESIFGEPDKTW